MVTSLINITYDLRSYFKVNTEYVTWLSNRILYTMIKMLLWSIQNWDNIYNLNLLIVVFAADKRNYFQDHGQNQRQPPSHPWSWSWLGAWGGVVVARMAAIHQPRGRGPPDPHTPPPPWSTGSWVHGHYGTRQSGYTDNIKVFQINCGYYETEINIMMKE